jgi:arylsulfatase A-like enzyme
MRRPNILFIMSDQEQTWDLLPQGLTRPGLDSLLERGTGFLRHHVVAVPCGPSRSVIYTGQHTARTGLHTNPSRQSGAAMSSSVPTIGGLLREHGYYTAYKGKWHLSNVEPPVPFRASAEDALQEYGFAEFNQDGDPVGLAWDGFRNDPAVASDAARWLHGHGGKPTDQPWFLAVNFVNPHDVMFFDPTGRMNTTGRSPVRRRPAPVGELYEREWDVPLPVSLAEDRSNKPGAQAALGAFVSAVLGEIPLDDEEAWRSLRSYYYNCLRDLDRHVRVVLQALADSGHADDTIVVYTSDHGEAAGAHGYREKPTSVYREVLNVPLVLTHPDASGGQVTSGLSSSVDLVPTVLRLAGLSESTLAERHPQLRGVDLSELVAAPSSATRRDTDGVLVSMSRPPMTVPDQGAATQPATTRTCLQGLLDGRWKLSRYFAAGQEQAIDVDRLDADADLELYDTVTDPHEITNLAYEPEHREVRDRLARQLIAAVEREVGASCLAG